MSTKRTTEDLIAEFDRLVAELDARGGRGVALAEQIDHLQLEINERMLVDHLGIRHLEDLNEAFLDSLVCEHKCEEASALNNAGRNEQIKYLLTTPGNPSKLPEEKQMPAIPKTKKRQTQQTPGQQAYYQFLAATPSVTTPWDDLSPRQQEHWTLRGQELINATVYAQHAFEAYNRVYESGPVAWESLSPEEQRGWRAAAQAVLELV